MKAKWAFYLGVADPDYIKRADENRQTRYRIVEEELIRVWLQKRHGKEKRFRIYTGHLTTTQERERLWPLDRQVAAAYRQLRPVVPEKLRTLDHGRPWSDDQFASTRLSSSRDMSR